MNNVIITGRLTKEVETRVIPNSSTLVATFTLAVDREYTKKDGTRDTDFIPVEVLGKTAEFCSKYLGKGRLVAIQGSLRFDRWNAPDGSYRTFAKVSARTVQALDKKNTSYSNTSEKTDVDEKINELATDLEESIPF